MNRSNNSHPNRAVSIWLYSICATLLLMIAIGGITRLTQSGLSIVEWAPILGAIPPLNEEAWQRTFDIYKTYPQFEKVFPEMKLAEFKWIYFWEFIHRLLGRSIGLIVLLPAIYFIVKKRLPPGLLIRVAIGFSLGGLQGLLGWYMVKSGLVNRPSVSHFRLASHFALALVILIYFQWITLKYFGKKPKIFIPQEHIKEFKKILASKFRTIGLLFVFPLLCIQLIYGAFVAGLKAGWIYNTFPKMHEHWFPPEALSLSPLLINMIENGATIQWIHRWLGFSLCFILPAWSWFTLNSIQQNIRNLDSIDNPKDYLTYLRIPFLFLSGLIITQYILGATMLVLHTPVTLGSLHQMLGVFILMNLVWVFFRIGYLAERR